MDSRTCRKDIGSVLPTLASNEQRMRAADEWLSGSRGTRDRAMKGLIAGFLARAADECFARGLTLRDARLSVLSAVEYPCNEETYIEAPHPCIVLTVGAVKTNDGNQMFNVVCPMHREFYLDPQFYLVFAQYLQFDDEKLGLPDVTSPGKEWYDFYVSWAVGRRTVCTSLHHLT